MGSLELGFRTIFGKMSHVLGIMTPLPIAQLRSGTSGLPEVTASSKNHRDVTFVPFDCTPHNVVF
jgi:hypothetical protein